MDARDVPAGYESRVGADGAVGYERTLRSLPLWLVREYLEDLGGRADPPSAANPSLPSGGQPRGDSPRAAEAEPLPDAAVCLAGDGWQATLEQVDDFQVGSFRVGQVRMTLTGALESLPLMMADLEKRLFRGGG